LSWCGEACEQSTGSPMRNGIGRACWPEQPTTQSQAPLRADPAVGAPESLGAFSSGARGAETCRRGLTREPHPARVCIVRSPSEGSPSRPRRSGKRPACFHSLATRTNSSRQGSRRPRANSPRCRHRRAPAEFGGVTTKRRNSGEEQLRSTETRPLTCHSSGFRYRRDTGDIHPKVAANRNRESPRCIRRFSITSGGQGIRTLDGCNPIAVFKPAAIFGGPVLQAP
jgi:hypothetical protein